MRMPPCYSKFLKEKGVPYELRHDKTNKMTVCPAKTQISLGICPVWSESSLCTLWVAKDPSFLNADSDVSIRLGGCPGCSESSRDAHSFCWFCHKAAYILQSLYNTTHFNTVLVITRPGLCSQMVIFLQFLYKIIPLKHGIFITWSSSLDPKWDCPVWF